MRVWKIHVFIIEMQQYILKVIFYSVIHMTNYSEAFIPFLCMSFLFYSFKFSKETVKSILTEALVINLYLTIHQEFERRENALDIYNKRIFHNLNVETSYVSYKSWQKSSNKVVFLKTKLDYFLRLNFIIFPYYWLEN